MKYLKIAIALAAGIGIAWAADEASDEPAETEISEAMTEAEVEMELQRIEEALGETDELKEFVPSKPLAADLPIDLPSDI
jgi:hypothetical protein